MPLGGLLLDKKSKTPKPIRGQFQAPKAVPPISKMATKRYIEKKNIRSFGLFHSIRNTKTVITKI